MFVVLGGRMEVVSPGITSLRSISPGVRRGLRGRLRILLIRESILPAWPLGRMIGC